MLAQNPLAGLLSPENLKRAERAGVEATPGPKPHSVILRFPSSETPGSLTVPVPAAARDWTGYGLTFEFQSNSTIRWEMQIRNRKGQLFTYRVQPYQDVPVKASITNALLTREYMNNRQFRGHWLSNWANHIDLAQVEALIIRMAPNREVTLRLGPFALVRGDVPDEVYVDLPLVDALGQWMREIWPGKVRTVEDLRRVWKREDAELARPEDFGFCAYGGWSIPTATCSSRPDRIACATAIPPASRAGKCSSASCRPAPAKQPTSTRPTCARATATRSSSPTGSGR